MVADGGVGRPAQRMEWDGIVSDCSCCSWRFALYIDLAVKGEADADNANFDAFAGISYPVYPGQMPVYQHRGQQWRRQLLPGWGMRAGLTAPRLTRPTPQWQSDAGYDGLCSFNISCTSGSVRSAPHPYPVRLITPGCWDNGKLSGKGTRPSKDIALIYSRAR